MQTSSAAAPPETETPNSKVGARGADPDLAAQVGRLARKIIDSIRNHSNMSKQEQTEQLRLLERAIDLVANAERKIENLESHIDHLESLSRTDFLTGIANRRGFDETLERTLAAATRHGDTGVVVLADLDYFKEVNDRHGHECGDAVLKAVAEVLGNNIRTTDFIARLGGDEFAIILAHTSPREGMYRAKRLQTLLRQSDCEHERRVIPLQASFGSANYNDQTKVSDLLRRADLAMYKDKRSKGLRYTPIAELTVDIAAAAAF